MLGGFDKVPSKSPRQIHEKKKRHGKHTKRKKVIENTRKESHGKYTKIKKKSWKIDEKKSHGEHTKKKSWKIHERKKSWKIHERKSHGKYTKRKMSWKTHAQFNIAPDVISRGDVSYLHLIRTAVAITAVLTKHSCKVFITIRFYYNTTLLQ